MWELSQANDKFGHILAAVNPQKSVTDSGSAVNSTTCRIWNTLFKQAVSARGAQFPDI
jgi:hypothetical protein